MLLAVRPTAIDKYELAVIGNFDGLLIFAMIENH